MTYAFKVMKNGNEFTLDRMNDLKKEGHDSNYIADYFGLTVTSYRKYRAIMLGQQLMTETKIYKRMKEKGISRAEICDILGVNESTLRSWDNNDSTVEFVQTVMDDES